MTVVPAFELLLSVALMLTRLSTPTAGPLTGGSCGGLAVGEPVKVPTVSVISEVVVWMVAVATEPRDRCSWGS